VLGGSRAVQRSDVWQLGLVLHEIVFERRPRWRTDGEQELLPPPPIEDEETPTGELMRILGACLNVDRKQRAASAVEIAERFEGATTSDFGARRRARRRSLLAFGAGLIAVVGVGAVHRLVGVGAVHRLRSVRHDAPDARPATASGTPAPVAAPAPSAEPAIAPSAEPTIAPSAIATPPTAGARLVHIRLESRPPQARVVDVETSELWGTTPLDVEQSASPRRFRLRLERPRFEPTVIEIAGDRDVTQTIELRPRREPGGKGEARAPAPPAVAMPPDEPGKI
jgi:hypothetical protein